MWEKLAEFASFETDRVYLRPFHFEDAEDLSTILLDFQTTRFIHPPVTDLKSCQILLVEAFMREPLGIWAIVDKATDRLIGSIRFENIQASIAKAEIGYFLNRDYWGRGIMPEVLATLVFMAFQYLKFETLIIKTHEENIASQRVAEKVGFKFLKSYKGSDRYTRRTRIYKDYSYEIMDYQMKEKK